MGTRESASAGEESDIWKGSGFLKDGNQEGFSTEIGTLNSEGVRGFIGTQKKGRFLLHGDKREPETTTSLLYRMGLKLP